MSIQENILSAVQTRLSGLASGRVFRDRREQIPTLPAIGIEPDACDETEEVLGYIDGLMTVAVIVYAAGDTPSASADATVGGVKALMTAGYDFGLGSNVQLLPGLTQEWDFENFDYVRVTLRYRVQYRS